MKNSRVRTLSILALISTDTVMITCAFLIAYGIRWESTQLDPNIRLAPLSEYFGLLIVQIVAIGVVMFWARLYHQARAVSRVDEFYGVFGAVSIGMMMSVAISTLLFKNLEFDFPRALIIYSWLLTIVLVMIARLIYHAVQWRYAGARRGPRPSLIVGTGDTGRLVLEKIKGSPHLGYEVIGFVHKNGETEPENVLGVLVLGNSDDLTRLIDERQIDEVIIALPEASDEEMLDLISKCSKASLSIKVFPDVFQIIATQVTIDDLGGLPLLSVRDVRQRGWRLTVKRLMDVTVSAVGLVFISPLLFITGDLDQTRIARPGVLRAGAHGTGCQTVHDDQVPLHAPGRRSQRPRLDRGRRSAPHETGHLHSQDQRRRTAAVHQRPDRRHEPGRSAPGTSGLRRTIPPHHSALHGTPQRKSRRHWLGASQRPARRHLRLAIGPSTICGTSRIGRCCSTSRLSSAPRCACSPTRMRTTFNARLQARVLEDAGRFLRHAGGSITRTPLASV